MAQLVTDIRGVMIPVTEARVLLPNASVSEVITYGTPQEIENAPEWVFGVIQWRGWRIPLFSFSLLSGEAEKENLSGAKVAIIKALSGAAQMPYMALLAQGFPRLTQITQENLLLHGDQDAVPRGVAHTVSVNDDMAFVPDLDNIERVLLEILEGRGDPEAPPPPTSDDLTLPDDLQDDGASAALAEVPSEGAREVLDDEPSAEELSGGFPESDPFEGLGLDEDDDSMGSAVTEEDDLSFDLGLDDDDDDAGAAVNVELSEGARDDVSDGLDLDDLDIDGDDDSDDMDLDLSDFLDEDMSDGDFDLDLDFGDDDDKD